MAVNLEMENSLIFFLKDFTIDVRKSFAPSPLFPWFLGRHSAAEPCPHLPVHYISLLSA